MRELSPKRGDEKLNYTVELFVRKLEEIEAKGYLVGGAIRDKILADIKGIQSYTPKDHDYVVTGVTQEKFEIQFPDANLVGKDFPVYLLMIDGESCEVALARTERKVESGHKGFKIITSPNLTIEDDLARRDLTINSMAISLHDGSLVDPFNGKRDLEKGIVRPTTDAFSEDPLRVYRVARFAAMLGVTPPEETLQAMRLLKGELSTLSSERVVEELKKALTTNTPSLFIETLERAGVLDVHYGYLERLKGLKQPKKHHPEVDVLIHTKQVMDAGSYYARQLSLKQGKNSSDLVQKIVFACMMHDVGKYEAKGINEKTGEPSYNNHEALGVSVVKEACKRFGISKWQPSIAFTTRYHGVFHSDILKMKAKKFVDFIEGSVKKEKVENRFIYTREAGLRKTIGIEEYIAVCSADKIGRNENHFNVFQRVLKEEHANAEFLRRFASESEKLKHEVDTSQFEGGEIGYQIYMDLRVKRIDLYQELRQEMAI